VILNIILLLFFLFVGRFISQKRKQIFKEIICNYEVLMNVKFL